MIGKLKPTQRHTNTHKLTDDSPNRTEYAHSTAELKTDNIRIIRSAARKTSLPPLQYIHTNSSRSCDILLLFKPVLNLIPPLLHSLYVGPSNRINEVLAVVDCFMDHTAPNKQGEIVISISYLAGRNIVCAILNTHLSRCPSADTPTSFVVEHKG